MLSHQPVVIDFEGFRYSDQPFVIKELSVRGRDYHDTLLFKPPHDSSLLSTKAKKVYSWLSKNLHGLHWEAGVYDYSFLFCFYISLKIRFPNITVYAKGIEKCKYLQCFFPHVIDLDQLHCPKASQLHQVPFFVCPNHNSQYLRDHCSREKVNLFFDWLCRAGNLCEHCSGLNAQKQATSNVIPDPNNQHCNNVQYS